LKKSPEANMSMLTYFIEKIETKVDGFVSLDNWRIKTVWVCSLVMLFSFFNNISPLKSFGDFYQSVFIDKAEYFLYQTVEDRANSLTGNFDYEPYSGKESRTFRLVAPIFVRVLGIKHISIVLYGLQLICGLLFFYLLSGFINEFLKDRSATFYAMLGIASIYLGASYFIDNGGYGDLFSYFFLFLSIYFARKPWLVFVFLSLAFWNDERAFVGSGLAFVWIWWYPQFKAEEKIRINFSWSMMAVILAWILWVVGRYYLMNVVGMNPTYNPDGEFMIRIQQSIDSLGFRLLWQFEGWWLLFLLASLTLWAKKEFLTLIPLFLAGAASSLSAMIIYDSTRSGTFAFIGIFFALAICKKYLTERQLRLILMGIALLCFLHPLANKTHGMGFFLM
jgi:hypothetical protein